MDIRFFTTFLDLVDTRHFGKTAENLYLTQSAVSARIKQLEEYFHTHLFIRQRNSLQLTPAGERLVPYAQNLCATLQDARTSLDEQNTDYVALGASPIVGELVLPHVSSIISRAHPDWVLKAESMTVESLSRRLHDRTIDIAFSTEALKSEDVESRMLLQTELALFIPVKKTTSLPYSGSFVGLEWTHKKNMFADRALASASKIIDTNSLCVGLAAQQKHNAGICLPTQTQSPLLTTLQTAYERLRQVDTLENNRLVIYANVLKPIQRSSIKQVLSLLDTLI